MKRHGLIVLRLFKELNFKQFATMALGVSASMVTSAYAGQVVTNCGALVGKSFYSKPADGWVDEGIKNGATIFIKDKGSYDVIVKDAIRTFSAIESGATVSTLSDDGEHITVLVHYPTGVAEVYQLTLDASGRGTLIYASMKNDTMGVTKGALFVAQCSK